MQVCLHHPYIYLFSPETNKLVLPKTVPVNFHNGGTLSFTRAPLIRMENLGWELKIPRRETTADPTPSQCTRGRGAGDQQVTGPQWLTDRYSVATVSEMPGVTRPSDRTVAISGISSKYIFRFRITIRQAKTHLVQL